MTGVIDAGGTLGEGALWARAAEPAAGETHGEGHGACLNCGTALAGRYCHACGQSSHVHKTLASIAHDLLHGVFHFEGKIWRTLPMLVVHPGRLTRRYIDGERAKFVSPLALFLFTIFLMFATFSALKQTELPKGIEEGWKNSASQLDMVRAKAAEQIATAARERAQLAAAGRPTAAIDQRLASLRKDAAQVAQIRRHVGGGDEGVRITSNLGWLDQRLEEARANPKLVIYKVQSAAYKFSWVLIFLSTPLVASLFLWRRRFGLYDHATFVTYSLSFMSLLVIVADGLLAAGAPSEVIVPLALLAPAVHMFVQLRGTYGLRRFSALWRTVLLLGYAFITLAAFVLGVIALEVAH